MNGTLLIAIIGLLVFIVNCYTIKNLGKERDFWKNKACLLKSGGKFGGMLRAENEMHREFIMSKKNKRR
jgi:hypothetical protein